MIGVHMAEYERSGWQYEGVPQTNCFAAPIKQVARVESN